MTLQKILFLLLISTSVLAQSSIRKIAIAGFISNGIDQVDLVTSESLLKMNFKTMAHEEIDLISTKSNDVADCFDKDCAIEIGKKNNADEVLVLEMARLGEKIMVQFILVDVKTEKIRIADQTSALNVEDLERVMKRVAVSVINYETVEESADVENIIASETTKKLRRKTFSYFGISFGYLYPQEGYDADKRSFTVDARIGYDIENYSIGLLLGGRDGFAMNLYGDYHFTKSDVCPYLGAGFGFHWISHANTYDYYGNHDNKEGDGFEILLNGGIKFLRTYNFQILANLSYALSLNDYNDKAIIFTLGILF